MMLIGKRLTTNYQKQEKELQIILQHQQIKDQVCFGKQLMIK